MRIAPAILFVLLGCAIVPDAGAEAGAAEAALRARLKRALKHPALEGARVSALVVDQGSGGVLFSQAPDRPLMPASNLKVLTGVAVLSAFGPSHRFSTGILAPGPVSAAGEVSSLYVRAGGDPAMTSEQWWRLAADLRALGLRRVRGDLVLDDSLFDDERWHPSWSPVSARAYHAPIGALSANYGAFRVTVTPAGVAGERARVTVDPPVDYLELVNHVTTAAAGSAKRIQVERRAVGERERVEVRGRVPLGREPVEVWRSVASPARYAGAVLGWQLAANGISVDGGVRRARVPAGAQSLLEFEGLPLSQVAGLFLKYSNNFIAEALVKDLGAFRDPSARGSWSAGLQTATRQLASLGLDVSELVIVDGSGLSRANRVTVRLLVSALREAADSFVIGPELLASLPIAGADGTLERRAGGAAGRVRAKTGLLSGVTGLSGFARTSEGEKLVFSILANGYRNGDGPAMDALDGFVAAMVESAGGASAASP